MPTSAPAVTGLVCAHDRGLGRAVALLMHASGLHVLDIATTAEEAVGVVEASSPQVVVVDAAVLGVRGLAILTKLKALSPNSTVVLVSPFPALAQPAIEAGATAMVSTADLRPLLPLLGQSRVNGHAGHACTCCSRSSSAAAADPERSSVSRLEASGGILRRSGTESLPTASSHAPVANEANEP